MDFRDRRSQRRGDVRVRVLVEADMAVTDLHEPQAVRRDTGVRGLFDRRALEDAAGHGPDRARADPRHAFQEAAAIPFRLVVLLFQETSPYQSKFSQSDFEDLPPKKPGSPPERT